MSKLKLPNQTLVHPMVWSYRLLFYFASVLGVVAVAAAVIELGDLDLGELYQEEMSRAEAWIALVVGFALNLFAWSALPRATMQLGPRGLSYLRFGPVCSTGLVEFDRIKRFGTGLEKHGHQRYHVLVLELHEGTKLSIKVSMYERWRELVEALGGALGQQAVSGTQGWTGVKLEDSQE